MSDKERQGSGGLMSSAGLTTFHEEESETVAFNPKTVTFTVLLFGILVITLNIFIV